MTEIDLLIVHARQLVTCASPTGPKRGAAMLDVGLIEDGAVAITAENIVAVGSSADLLARFSPKAGLDASG